jgi:hypothetical protein
VADTESAPSSRSPAAAEKLAALVEMMDLWSSKKPVETAKERNAGSRHQK